MNKRLKVLFVESCDYENFPIGGQHSFIKALASNISHEIYLAGITTDKKYPVRKWSQKRFNNNLTPFFAVRLINDTSRLSSIIPARIKHYYSVWRSRKMLLGCQPDIIFAQSVESIKPLFHPASSSKFIFAFAGAYNPLSHSRFKWARWSVFQSIYENLFLKPVIVKSSRVVAINDECVSLAKKHRGGLVKNWVKLFLGVDRNVFYEMNNRQQLRREFSVPENTVVLICVGRLAKVKGLELAIDLLNKLYINRDVRLFLVGEGEEKEFLKDRARKSEVDCKVTFFGAQDHRSLSKLLNISDVFFMPSLAEGLPVALLEAMSCGLPVVASKIGGIPELINDGENGILLNKHTVDEACVAIDRAMSLRNLLRKNAINTIIEKCSIESTAKKIDLLISEAASESV